MQWTTSSPGNGDLLQEDTASVVGREASDVWFGRGEGNTQK